MSRKSVPAAKTCWHNFVTGADDWRSDPPATDEAARCYIPQDSETQAYYDWLRAQEDVTPVAAIRAIVTRALDAFTPQPARPSKKEQAA